MWRVIKVKGNGSLDCDCFYSREKHLIGTHRATVYLHLKAHPAPPSKAEMPRKPVNPAPSMAQCAERAILDTGTKRSSASNEV